MHDIQYAWRRLRSSPAVSSVAVLTMALGIAAATSVFSVAAGVLWRPLPYADPSRLVMVWDRWTGWPSTWMSEAEFLDYRDKARSFSAVGAFTDLDRNLTGGQAPERVHVGRTSVGVFTALAVRPLLGRVFTADEDHQGAERVAVISYGLWRRRYGADPHVLGRTMMLDDSATTIVGVMPSGFQLPLDFEGDATDLWVPLALGPVDPTARGGHYLNLVARLGTGATVTGADTEVRGMAQRMVLDYPRRYPPNFGAFIRPLASQVLGDIRPTVLVLTTAVGFVLLIACANVANLLLARVHARQREIALRASLGASRRRIVEQLLVEALVLTALGGCLAALLALIGVHALAAAAPRDVPRIQNIAVNGPVLLCALVLTIVTGLLCGLAPALRATRTDLHVALKEGGRGSAADHGSERVRRVLIVAEVTLSVVLLIGAGLLARSFSRLRAIDPGFDASSVLTAQLSLPASKYPDNASVRAFYRRAVAAAHALPGVSDAAVVRVLPLTAVMGDWSFRQEGTPMGQDNAAGDWQVVSSDYFHVMRIPVAAGRAFSDADDERAPGAVIVNQALARRAWPGEQALGRRIRMGGSDTSLRTVVGIVANIHHRGLDADPRPEIYLPHAQWTNGGGAIRDMYLVLRSSQDPRALMTDLRRTIRVLDPDLPLANVRTMDNVLRGWSASRRISFLVLAVLATAAATLAAIGLYSVISYGVVQRTTEIGIRRALGATTSSVIALVARQGAASVATGIAIGLGAAYALCRLMAAMLFQISAADPLTFVAVPLLVLVAAAVATYVPAWRATRVDPLTAVRS